MSGTRIPQSEMDDYQTVLCQRRLLSDSFELMTSAADLAPGQHTYTRGTVSVRRLGVGAFRSYHFSTWVADFARDLDAGQFALPCGPVVHNE